MPPIIKTTGNTSRNSGTTPANQQAGLIGTVSFSTADREIFTRVVIGTGLAVGAFYASKAHLLPNICTAGDTACMENMVVIAKNADKILVALLVIIYIATLSARQLRTDRNNQTEP
ncbi:hypothetical protein QS306_01660 [Paraburkholderia bonniea]|uniref:hypothetical protein n=1 Tax=Paraburkholderia bonniea TaxID=2152891 RepID=UPI0025739CEF|nr:hypothetical protein [Paraburkholderia bonniea]WJF90416.1 hypothetical protein QS306_01660 [Paraburkholderia bonniea]WJF93731.1 hypothetical protein QS308_01660 [Paraburkholderia bonniea]